MKITYLHHSAFLIELKHHLLLFDWVNTPLCELPKDKPLYVFVSHHHEDHFHEAIFTLAKIHPDVHYLISDDVPCKDRKDVLVCACDQIYEVDDLQVKTIASTDEGVAFLVMCEQNIIYHAGDLNWWDWGEEDSEEEAEKAKKTAEEVFAKGGVSADMPTSVIPDVVGMGVLDMLVKTGLLPSKGEARRLVQQNGLSINDVKYNDVNGVVTEDMITDEGMIIKKGKKTFHRVVTQ